MLKIKTFQKLFAFAADVAFCVALWMGSLSTALASTDAHHVPTWDDIAKPLIFRVINFVLFVAILYFALRKPIATALASRRKDVEEVIKGSAERKAWAEQMYADYDRRLRDIGKEVDEIHASLKKEGQEEARKLKSHAEDLAASVRKEGQMMADAEVEEFKVELRIQVAESAATTAKETILSSLRPDDHERLSKEFLGQMGRASS